MPRFLLRALATALAVAVPLVLVGNALWLLLGSWFVDFQYALPAFPDADRFDDPQRTELAKLGVDSIRPGGEGVGLLREAALADGSPAFAPREVSHMADVRGVVAGFLTAWGVALAAGAAATLILWRQAGSASVRQALRHGALATLIGMAAIGLVMAVAFESFFDAFHGVFFAEGTWQFADRYTLRQLYPDAFWAIAGATIAVLVLLQAALLLLLTRRRDSAPSAPA